MSTLIGGTTEPGGLRTGTFVRGARSSRPLARRRDGGLGEEEVTTGTAGVRPAGGARTAAGVATTTTDGGKLNPGEGVSTRGGEAVGLGPVEADAAVT